MTQWCIIYVHVCKVSSYICSSGFKVSSIIMYNRIHSLSTHAMLNESILCKHVYDEVVSCLLHLLHVCVFLVIRAVKVSIAQHSLIRSYSWTVGFNNNIQVSYHMSCTCIYNCMYIVFVHNIHV